MLGDKTIVIGCPVMRREWIIDLWVDHVLASLAKTDLDFAFLFVGAEGDPTLDILNERFQRDQISGYLRTTDESRNADKRDWGENRYHQMVAVRNDLLAGVRTLQPDYFLSLDSDILIHSSLISNLVESLDRFDAVGGRCYMTPKGTSVPSLGIHNGPNMRRPDCEGVITVDIIMAIKMMTPASYNIDYEWEHRGEDLGWSKACKDAGLKLGFDGRCVNKHVMRYEDLDEVDSRCGY